MLGSKNGSRCSNCDVISDLVIVFTPQGKKGFCGPVCAVNYEQKKMMLEGEYEERYNAPMKTGVRAVSKEIQELDKLIDSLKRIDYYSTITYTRRKRLTLERIRDICEKIKIQIDSLKYDSTFRAEDEIGVTVKDVIRQFYWTMFNLKNMINTDVKETQKFIEKVVGVLEEEYPEIKNEFE
jgi:hypothetical protein